VDDPYKIYYREYTDPIIPQHCSHTHIHTYIHTQVDDPYKIYYRVYGPNNTAATALFLHGGPGAGCFPNHARFFDPSHYRYVCVGYTHIHTQLLHAYTGMDSNVCAYIHTHIHTTCIHIHIHTYRVVWTSEAAVAQSRAGNIHTYKEDQHTCLYIYIHAYIHIHIHTYRVMLMDQRGCGRSEPRGFASGNIHTYTHTHRGSAHIHTHNIHTYIQSGAYGSARLWSLRAARVRHRKQHQQLD
jgi:hypothetical protein